MSDDITFCYAECDMFNCKRNKVNIKDPTKLHSWMPKKYISDCPLNAVTVQRPRKVKTIKDSKLMACPFCGGYVHQDMSAQYFRENMLYCEGCDMYFALDAINATEADLEKAFNVRYQEQPVKPIIDDEYRCGNCAHKLTVQQKFGDNVLFVEKFDYCPACGRKVKWDDSD